MRAGPAKYALIAAVVVAGVIAASIALGTDGRRQSIAHPTASLTLGAPRSPSASWDLIRAAAFLRNNALGPHRTTFHRAFAAYMGLSALIQIHHTLRGRCAVAVSYLYDNLLDLHDAYTGEDWTQLRQAVATQPSLQVCAPRRRSARLRYVE